MEYGIHKMVRTCTVCGKEFKGNYKKFRCPNCKSKEVSIQKMKKVDFSIKSKKLNEKSVSDLPI